MVPGPAGAQSSGSTDPQRYCQSGLHAGPSRRTTDITVIMRKSGDVCAASRSSADRFGSMAELPLFRRPKVMRRSNCRPPGGDRRR
jgi:hypothetical protein